MRIYGEKPSQKAIATPYMEADPFILAHRKHCEDMPLLRSTRLKARSSPLINDLPQENG